MKLLVQPGDGVTAILDAINAAKKSVEIVIFRFDETEVETALANAVGRGVFVHALIAYTNRGGEKNLRKLEMRLLAAGVTVARTADDLARYHSKFLIFDRKQLFLLSYNFTHLDIDHSRCFGLIIDDDAIVEEAVKLFEADIKRQEYVPALPHFVVSPVNSRKSLSEFLKGAKKELLIYDPEVSDPAIIKILAERAKAGVAVKVIGKLAKKSRGAGILVRKLTTMRLHTRTILRDGSQAFIGSQSLRELELGSRREVGLIFRDAKIVPRLVKLFMDDWNGSEETLEAEPGQKALSANRVAKKVAKAVTKDLPKVTPVLSVIVNEVAGDLSGVNLSAKQIEETVKDAVKEAVKEAVRGMVEDSGVAPNTEPPAK